MRAYEIVSAGGIDALALNQRQTLRPGPGEILVEMQASVINYRDLSTVETPLARAVAMPRIPDSDGAGEAVEVGEGVSDFKLCDRGAAHFGKLIVKIQPTQRV